MTADSITIAIPTALPAAGGNPVQRGAIAGFVITSVPEPTSISLVGLGLALALSRRSRK